MPSPPPGKSAPPAVIKVGGCKIDALSPNRQVRGFWSLAEKYDCPAWLRGVASASFSFSLIRISPRRARRAPASPQTPPTGTATGVVRTSEGVGVPGATLRLVETATGRAWVTWTDENGHFDLPALPQGHYRIEVSQLGFDNATQEFDLGGTPAAVNVPLKVASLQSLETPPPAPAPNAAPAAGAAASGNASENPAAPNSNTQAPNQSAKSKSPTRSRTGLRRRRAADSGAGNFPAVAPHPAQARMARPRRPNQQPDRHPDRQLDQRAHQRARAGPFSK